MIQIKKENIIKTYREKDILIETIKQFHYSTEEEKMAHCKLMEDEGFIDSGQVKQNIGTVMKPEYVYFKERKRINESKINKNRVS